MRLYLLRHGHTRVIDGDYFGSGLSAEGMAATLEFAGAGLIPRPDVILASPFRRARETAEVFGEVHKLDVEEAAFLGEWRLQRHNLDEQAYRREEEAGWADHSLVVEGGESLDALAKRALAGVEAVARRPGVEDALLVAHGTIIDVLCARLAGRPARIDDIHAMQHLAYAIIEANGGRLRLLKDVVEA